MMEEYERKERQEREYEQHKAEIEKQKQETISLKESLRKQREYEQQQQLHAEKIRLRQQERLSEHKQEEERKKQAQIKKENIQESISKKIQKRTSGKNFIALLREFGNPTIINSTLNNTTTAVTIRKLYIKTLAMYHPDRAQNLPIEESVEREEIYKLLQNAYDNFQKAK